MGGRYSKKPPNQVLKYTKSQLRLLEAEHVKANDALVEQTSSQVLFYELPRVKERRIKITRMILLDKGEFGPVEASLFAKMLVYHYNSTPNHALALKALQRELQLIRIHGEEIQKDAVRLIDTLTEDEIKRYGEIAYTSQPVIVFNE